MKYHRKESTEMKDSDRRKKWRKQIRHVYNHELTITIAFQHRQFSDFRVELN